MEADKQALHIKNRDGQVKSLASYLEMEGYDRAPFNERQLQSFHKQVRERQDQDTEALNRVLVSFFFFLICRNENNFLHNCYLLPV